MKWPAYILYLLRHFWLWPFVFWLRPMDVIQRGRKEVLREMLLALLGFGLWGTLGGVLLWWSTGDTQSGFVFAAAAAAATAGAAAGAAAVAVAAAAAAAAGAGAGAGAGAVTGAVAGDGDGDGAAAGGLVILIILVNILVGTGLHQYVSPQYIGLITAIGAVVILLHPVLAYMNSKGYLSTRLHNIYFSVSAFCLLIFFPSMLVWAFIHVPPPMGLGMSVLISLLLFFSSMSGFFGELVSTIGAGDMSRVEDPQQNWLLYQGILFPVLALLAWYVDPELPGLETKLSQLATFLVLLPLFFSGLAFYPFLALAALWQMRPARAKHYTRENCHQLMPFRWQSFPFPLPALAKYMIRVAAHHGIESAFHALQQLQMQTLQQRAARRAAQTLAADRQTALPFCGFVAMHTNTATLLPLAATGPVARAVASLVPKKKDIEVYLRTGSYPPKSGWPLPWRPKAGYPAWFKPFDDISGAPLSRRVRYALDQLEECGSHEQAPAFRDLLQRLSICLEVESIAAALALPGLSALDPAPSDDWLAQGWHVLRRMAQMLKPLENYAGLTSRDGRQTLLLQTSQEVEKAQITDEGEISEYWHGLSPYWGHIGSELARHWTRLLKREAELSWEVLNLEIEPPRRPLPMGEDSLRIEVRNTTTTIARRIHLRVDAEDGEDGKEHLFFTHREADAPLLAGHENLTFSLGVRVNRAGAYRVGGQVKAEDLQGRGFVFPFAFKIQAAQTGRPYAKPPHDLYIAGEGIGQDDHFIGREHLLERMLGLWRQPGGKPAVVLMGQRRIGKTSLLNKILRLPLEKEGVLTVKTTIQGISGARDFWQESSRKMAHRLGCLEPALAADHPFADFKTFLNSVALELAGRRFLIMVDEADLIPRKRLGDDFPGFLRTLMQEPEYPTLLLLCHI
ncbi:MAG: hypothetical protein HQL77_08710 [Magnetococcales bacterium]|nr:hypothetical protein [Magnetococcales bacterium]